MVCDITMTTQQCKVVSVVFWHITYHCIMVESIGISSILLEVCWLSEALAYIIYHVGHDIVITHQCSIISSLAYIIYHVYYIWYISLYRGSKHQHQLKIVFCQIAPRKRQLCQLHLKTSIQGRIMMDHTSVNVIQAMSMMVITSVTIKMNAC